MSPPKKDESPGAWRHDGGLGGQAQQVSLDSDSGRPPLQPPLRADQAEASERIRVADKRIASVSAELAIDGHAMHVVNGGFLVSRWGLQQAPADDRGAGGLRGAGRREECSMSAPPLLFAPCMCGLGRRSICYSCARWRRLWREVRARRVEPLRDRRRGQ